jgi:hypothetical protein
MQGACFIMWTTSTDNYSTRQNTPQISAAVGIQLFQPPPLHALPQNKPTMGITAFYNRLQASCKVLSPGLIAPTDQPSSLGCKRSLLCWQCNKHFNLLFIACTFGFRMHILMLHAQQMLNSTGARVSLCTPKQKCCCRCSKAPSLPQTTTLSTCQYKL